ncbi:MULTISPECIES: hypothetical protein [unclassified Tatumella]|uniref:hypothetical protein n=1 Tax=unclassified Tatumella TaxID=2649542 RepID=UPI001BB09E9C|nr:MULTISPECIES: hypothetical protein [unclassified Tatumella]MBS0878389.1 hypothetical protein [Tatumella sp. JGM82]MBS0891185.1 hypothetical protein [Tatumella sp. JGM94]MBS0902742.1 hypothetical protein [Tatumella sp. JGM100]
MKTVSSLLATSFLSVSLLSGCSVYDATHQPDKKDISLFKNGTPRSDLLAEFGIPTAETQHDGKNWDLWRFTQGYSGGVKASRAVGHGVMDVLTLGIWEVAGTPIESAADGTKMAYEVSYDKNQRVDQVIAIKK